MLQSDCFSFDNTRNFLGGPFLFSHLQVHYTLQLATLARKNLCVPATSTQAAASLAGWDGCWKRRLFLSGDSFNTQLFLKDSVEFKIAFVIVICFRQSNLLYSFLDSLSNGFIFFTSEYLIFRKLPYIYIRCICKTFND